MYGIFTVNSDDFRQPKLCELLYGIFTVNFDNFRQSERYEQQYWPALKTSAATVPKVKSSLESLKTDHGAEVQGRIMEKKVGSAT